MHRQLTKTLTVLMAEETTFAVMFIAAMLFTNGITLVLTLVMLALLLIMIFIDIRTVMLTAKEIDNAALQRTEAIKGIINIELRTNENFRLLAKAVEDIINPEEETENTTNDNDQQ